MECQSCHKHKATENWVGEGGTMAMTHGMYQRWCKCCCLKEQIKHAERMAIYLKQWKRALRVTKCDLVPQSER